VRRTLRRVFDSLKVALTNFYGDLTVRPVLVAPNDAGGGIAGVPIFINSKPKGPIASLLSAVSAMVDGIVKPDTREADQPTSFVERSRSETLGTVEPGTILPLSSGHELEDNVSKDSVAALDLDAALSENPDFRTTMYRFFRLAPSQMSEIVGTLKLGLPEDSSMPELDRFKAALRRALSEGKIGNLEKLIAKAETRK
jgi:hypothetical protein